MDTRYLIRVVLLAWALSIPAISASAGPVKPEAESLMTKWAADVQTNLPLPEYPRPGLVRTNWLNINGIWDLSVTSLRSKRATYSGQVLVPFPVESALSKVHRRLDGLEELRYERKFHVPGDWRGQRILLHFEAVNWETAILLNGREIGTHKGGYDRFSFDITDALNASGDQDLMVLVLNPGDRGEQPRGKQSIFPHGIWYTMASGIWQTVWLEPVPDVSIDTATLVPDVDHGALSVSVTVRGPANDTQLKAEAYDGEKEVGSVIGPATQVLKLKIQSPILWSPEAPFLYNLRLTLFKGPEQIDTATGYFGMRKINVGVAGDGRPTIMLNGKPYFQLGVLDQGYWPDGIYTAPTDPALRSDVELIKHLGFNACRKHEKVEPERWYYWCDRLGLLVWQDMPSAVGAITSLNLHDETDSKVKTEFDIELKDMIQQHQNNPSIVMWIAFNQGWGQHDTARIVQLIKSTDPTRLVIGASGWIDKGVGDVSSVHGYPYPDVPTFKDARPLVWGECGGYKFPILGHLWQPNVFGGTSPAHDLDPNDTEKVGQCYSLLFEEIAKAKTAGLSGAIVTQLTDVENEVTGLVTYDRKILKLSGSPVGLSRR